MGLLDGKRAVVTGGASGIGLAVCRRLRAEGASVAVVDIRAEGARNAAKEIDGLAYEADVGDAAQLAEVIATAARAMGGLSILVNNAGIGHLALLHETSPEEFDRLLRVNLTGVFHAMRAANTPPRPGHRKSTSSRCKKRMGP